MLKKYYTSGNLPQTVHRAESKIKYTFSFAAGLSVVKTILAAYFFV